MHVADVLFVGYTCLEPLVQLVKIVKLLGDKSRGLIGMCIL